MKDSGSREVVAQAPRHPLWIWSRIAVVLGILSPLLFVLGVNWNHSSGAPNLLDWSIYVAISGWGVSLGCLILATVSARKHTRQSLEGMVRVLPIPFITSLPALLIGGMLDSWKVHEAKGSPMGILLIGSMILFPVVMITCALVERRGSTP
jgi:hypothetical protein